MEKLYEILMKDLDLTDETLKQFGFSSQDIENLINDKKIRIEDNGKYRLANLNKFRRYGIDLLQEKKFSKAIACFKKCYEIDPYYKEACLQYMLSLIKTYDYNKAFEVFDNLEIIAKDNDILNNNLYLYLLSIVTKCPEKHIKKLQRLKEEDLMLPYFRSNRYENMIREYILKGKFAYAYSNLNTLISKTDDYSIKYELIKGLLAQAIGCDKQFKANLLELANNKEYSEIVLLLKEKESLRKLNNLEMHILLLANTMLNIEKTNIIPDVIINNTDDMFEAIKGNNFELALNLSNQFNEEIAKEKNKDIINVLLVSINEKIASLKLIPKDICEIDNYNKYLKEIEDMAYSFQVENISLDKASIKYGLFNNVVLLIKLIYARDYYMEGNYLMGDALVKEVELNSKKTPEVMYFMNEVKFNRDKYKLETDSYKRNLVKIEK